MGTETTLRVLEASYQDEFYRTILGANYTGYAKPTVKRASCKKNAQTQIFLHQVVTSCDSKTMDMQVLARVVCDQTI